VADRSVITGNPGAAAIIKWKLDVAVLRESTLYYGRRQICSRGGAVEEGLRRVWGICKSPGGAQGGGGKGFLNGTRLNVGPGLPE